MSQKITVLGSFVVDLMARTPHLPAAGETVRKTLENTARRPFRTGPDFDPGVWGGQWMKTHCGLDPAKVNYAWSFVGVPEENFAVDLTIARGLDYYTGTVYETALLDHPEIGSVCSGGRYDTLAEYYTDKQLPGVGISIGLTRLFYVLGEQGMLNGDLPTAPADVLILPMTEDLSAAVTLATKLRDAGVRTQLYTEQKKFKAKMNYADKTGVPYVVFLGEDEVKNNVIACKDMTSGEQTTLNFDATLARIRDGLAERNKGKVIVEK